MTTRQKSKYINITLVVLILLTSTLLRYKNLGYSEFQDDEKKAMAAVEKDFSWDFFMKQRKGPIQFLVAGATTNIIGNNKDEYLHRVPFATLNLASVYIMWLILKRLFDTKSAFLGTLIYSANGFVVGFSRIVQYQNLNLLFSLLSLYFFIRLSQDKKRPYILSILGTTSFCISLLSHWDAIFFLIPIAVFYIKNIKGVDKKTALRLTVTNIVWGGLILLPFLIPYIISQLNNQINTTYFSRRVGLSTYPLGRHKLIFELYNPFITIYFIPLLTVFSLIKPEKSLTYIAWTLINFLSIKLFMQKPGTHIYNYVIPLIFAASSGIYCINTFKKKNLRMLLSLVIMALTAFLMYQTYIIFVDHDPEYPWYEKDIVTSKVIKLTTKRFADKEVLTFGFPHFRQWKTLNETVKNDIDNCSYITNEGKEISQNYMENNYGIYKHRCYFVINIRRPFITRGNNAAFAETRGKEKVYEYEQNNHTFVDVYKIPNGQDIY